MSSNNEETSNWEQQGGGSLGANGTFVFGFGLGLIIAAMGALFCFGLWVGYQRAMETRSWDPVDCVVIKSDVREQRPTPNSPMAYLLDLEYQFTYQGESRIGTKRKRVDGPSSKRKKAAEWRKELPEGMATTCWVDPEDPTRTVLEHGSKAALYSIWFPGLFLVGGLGIMAASLRQRLRAKS